MQNICSSNMLYLQNVGTTHDSGNTLFINCNMAENVLKKTKQF